MRPEVIERIKQALRRDSSPEELEAVLRGAKRAEINSKFSCQDEHWPRKSTLLHEAARQGDMTKVYLLLLYGANARLRETRTERPPQNTPVSAFTRKGRTASWCVPEPQQASYQAMVRDADLVWCVVNLHLVPYPAAQAIWVWASKLRALRLTQVRATQGFYKEGPLY